MHDTNDVTMGGSRWAQAALLFAATICAAAWISKHPAIAAPWVAVALSAAGVVASVAVLRSPTFARGPLIAAALVMGLGILGAALSAQSAGGSLAAAAVKDAGYAWLAIWLIALSPPSGGRCGRSSTLLLLCSGVVATAMIAAEIL